MAVVTVVVDARLMLSHSRSDARAFSTPSSPPSTSAGGCSGAFDIAVVVIDGHASGLSLVAGTSDDLRVVPAVSCRVRRCGEGRGNGSAATRPGRRSGPNSRVVT